MGWFSIAECFLMVFILGGHYPSGIPVNFNDPSNWTLVQIWDTRDGDLANITTGMTFNSNEGFAWSYDGTKLTIANANSDNIYTFTCSTPWDPDTANATPTATRAETNPAAIQYNDVGSRLYIIGAGAGDVLEAIGCADFVIGTDADESEVTKAEVGFTGGSDGSFTINVDDTFLLWEGQVSTQENIKRLTMSSAGDLDTFSVAATAVINPPITVVGIFGSGLSVMSLDTANFYRIEGSVRLVTMSTPGDISTLSYGTAVNIENDLTLGFLPTKMWINPNDTSEVWVGGDVAGVQLARINTGA